MHCTCNCKPQQLKDPNIDLSKLDPVFAAYGHKPGSAITILQKAQDLYGYLPLDLLQYIARSIGVKPAKLLGVATFYTQFRLEPAGQNLIMLCQGTACHVNGSKAIAEAITDELGIEEGQTTGDGLFTFTNVACLGCCSLSPVMMINDETFGSLTPQSARKILQNIKEQNSKEA